MNGQQKGRWKAALKKWERGEWSYQSLSDLALQIVRETVVREKGLVRRLKAIRDTVVILLEMARPSKSLTAAEYCELLMKGA